MGRARVMIKGELEETLKSYRSNQEFPLSLAVLMNAASAEYFSRRGYSSSSEEVGSQPKVCEHAPRLRVGPEDKTAAEMVIGDRG